MWRKKLISPEKIAQDDSIEYRFKVLFLPYFSYVTAVFIAGAFISVFIDLTTGNIAKFATFTLIFWSSFILILPSILTHLVINTSDNIFTSECMSGFNWWLCHTYINWQEITSIKSYQVMEMRCLSIKTTCGKNIQFTPRFYKTSQILDRVRELAGEDHILVRALEKELSRPRYELTKLWCGVIGSIVLTMSIYLIGGNMYAAEQEKPLDQAIATYVRQHPKTAPNPSAIELQALMTKLGLSVEAFGDGSEVKVKPEKAAIAEWKAIQPIFETYLFDKQRQTKESSEPVPEKLSNYRNIHQVDLQAIETHLINNPIPEWGSDSSWLEKSDPKAGDSPLRSTSSINYFSLVTLQNLMIVNAIDKQRLPNIDSFNDLVAIERIQKSFQAQPSLLGQVISRIGEIRISRLARKLDIMPIGWGDNLFDHNRHSQMFSSILNEALSNSRFFQSPDIFHQLLIENQSPLRFIPGYYQLARPRIRLATVERYLEIQERLIYWSNQNICRTDGKSGVKAASTLGLGDYNYLSLITPLDLANQYRKILSRDLFWELTTNVRQAKAKLATGQKVDSVAKEFNLPSKVCPGEQWTAKANDGNITIEFSHPPNWKALGIHPDNIDPLTYTIKSIE
jgi:hypothetical protein